MSERAWVALWPIGKRRIALCAVAVVAAVLLAFFVEHRRRQNIEAHASSELVDDYIETLRLQDGGQLRVAPTAVISIDGLLAAYDENEFAAAAKYENPGIDCLLGRDESNCHVVETSSTIRDMGRDGDGAYISLVTAREFVVVEARFGKAEQDSLQTLRRGQHVTIRCLVRYDAKRYKSSGLLLTRCGVAP